MNFCGEDLEYLADKMVCVVERILNLGIHELGAFMHIWKKEREKYHARLWKEKKCLLRICCRIVNHGISYSRLLSIVTSADRFYYLYGGWNEMMALQLSKVWNANVTTNIIFKSRLVGLSLGGL